MFNDLALPDHLIEQGRSQFPALRGYAEKCAAMDDDALTEELQAWRSLALRANERPSSMWLRSRMYLHVCATEKGRRGPTADVCSFPSRRSTGDE